MKRIIAITALSFGIAGAATAGTLEDPVVETPPAAPVVPVAPVSFGGDWTGPYVGLSYGRLDAETGGADENGAVYGAFAGYDYDFGRFVLGGELDYQATDDFSVGGADIDSITRLKLRAGYDAGPALIYATAGGARADTSIGDADGAVYGLGLDYKVTERFTVGAEYLAHDFNDIDGTGVDVDADTISLRGAFRF